ncbi:MAG: hypothetical protein ABFD00_09245 [Chloroherpetonaceae bacterium]
MRESLKEIVNKTNELKELLNLGQKAIPSREEIFVFISEIEPLLEEIHQSISENLKKMTSAKCQISKVCEAAELATTDILDTMDNLSNETTEIRDALNDFNNLNTLLTKYREQILKIIHNKEQYNSELKILFYEIENLINSMNKDSEDFINNNHSKIENILHAIDEDSMDVILDLQVQDITSQQLSAVSHLIFTVQEKLINILQQFENSQLDDLELQKILNSSQTNQISSLAPAPIDSYYDKEGLQNSVDEFINTYKSKKSINLQNENNIIQDDIDKLFSHNLDFGEFGKE